MVAKTYTVAFEGVEARIVEVQCAISSGVPAFTLVGLPDKAVTEAEFMTAANTHFAKMDADGSGAGRKQLIATFADFTDAPLAALDAGDFLITV